MADEIGAGAVCLFKTLPMTGWTKLTDVNDVGLRIVSGEVGSGGTNSFSSTFASITPTGTVTNPGLGTIGATTLSTTNVLGHTHTITANTTTNTPGKISNTAYNDFTAYTAVGGPRGINTTDTVGGSNSHSHSVGISVGGPSFVGTAINFSIRYVDLIRALRV